MNLRWLSRILAHEAQIREGVGLEFSAGPWRSRWAHMRFRIPYVEGQPKAPVAQEAARIMRLLIERTVSIVRDLKRGMQ